MTHNRRAAVVYLEGNPVANNVMGFLKWRADQDVAFDNCAPLDVDEQLVLVGHSVTRLVEALAALVSLTATDGYTFASDGQITPLKNRVPSPNPAVTPIFPQEINDSMQILANVALACDAATGLNALSEACGTAYACLLTPQWPNFRVPIQDCASEGIGAPSVAVPKLRR